MDSGRARKSKSHGESAKHTLDISVPGSAPKSPFKQRPDVRQRTAIQTARRSAPSTHGRGERGWVTQASQTSLCNGPQASRRASSISSTYTQGLRSEPVEQESSLPRPGNDEHSRDITVAVIGEASTGKSTFIRCALDLKRPMTGTSATKKVSLEGEVSALRLLEVQISALAMLSDEDTSQAVGGLGQTMDHLDGALLMYDITNKESIRSIPQILCRCLIS